LQPKVPDRRGHFGPYGGRYVAETLMPALTELEQAYAKARRDTAFRKEFHFYLTEYAGRETPLYFAERLSEKAGGAKIYLTREDLVRAGMAQILALQINFRTAGLFA
jgi:tryptophan synthase beta chain